MSAINPPVVREQARTTFLQLLRAKYWSDEDRNRLQIEPVSVLPASDVVDELADVPLGLFRPVWDDLRSAYENAPRQPRGPFEGVPKWVTLALAGKPVPSEDRRVQLLHDSVIDWAKSWHLEAEWFVEIAFETLGYWCERPKALTQRSWSPVVRSLLLTPVNFQIDQWDGVEPLSVYVARERADLRKRFDDYVKKLTMEAKLGDVPVILNRHGGAAYCWAVRSQVLRHTRDQIARESDTSKGNVDEAVRTLLVHLDLPIRPKRRGRPPGSRDREPRVRNPQ